MAAPGVVDDLMRQHQRARRERRTNGADGGDRDHFERARVLQRPEIRAVVHLVRRDGMAVAVTREKHDLALGDAAEGERARRLAVGRARYLAAGHLHVAELAQPGAADDGEHQDSRMARISGRLRQ